MFLNLLTGTPDNNHKRPTSESSSNVSYAAADATPSTHSQRPEFSQLDMLFGDALAHQNGGFYFQTPLLHQSTSKTPTTSPDFLEQIDVGSGGAEVPHKRRKYTKRAASDLSCGSTADGEKLRIYRCTVEGCGRDFLSSGHLVRHSRIHTQERPFKCSLPRCDMAFARSDTAIKHSRGHIKKLQIAGHEIAPELLSPKVTFVNSPQGRARKNKMSKDKHATSRDVSQSCPPDSFPVMNAEFQGRPLFPSFQLAPPGGASETPIRSILSPLIPASAFHFTAGSNGQPAAQLEASDLWNQWLQCGVNENQLLETSLGHMLLPPPPVHQQHYGNSNWMSGMHGFGMGAPMLNSGSVFLGPPLRFGMGEQQDGSQRQSGFFLG
ncbi:hypothetical protein HDU98_004472 [Podochytrium sp. JEL0797]|nr:hypothetical protein HDU98_004472 [Podochytrium sp. JEL0797]